LALLLIFNPNTFAQSKDAPACPGTEITDQKQIDELSKKVVRVDGDGRFTEQKLVGAFDPKMALEKGFTHDSFLPGPLYQAMSEGEILLINELNRMPEMVQNVLLPAMDEGIIQIPYLGELKAKPGFAIIATQNPREFIATSALSEALLDRLEWIAIQPLSAEQELEVVLTHLPGKISDELRKWVEKNDHASRTHSFSFEDQAGRFCARRYFHGPGD